jgi:hypothetical protein
LAIVLIGQDGGSRRQDDGVRVRRASRPPAQQDAVLALARLIGRQIAREEFQRSFAPANDRVILRNRPEPVLAIEFFPGVTAVLQVV